MSLRIGIVGAENSHCVAVARTLNVDKACGGARVVAVWGETRSLAEKAAKEGRIPLVVRKPSDMIGHVDGVMIDHRHAKYHVPAALPFVDAGIPVFVDKPFSYTVREGWNLLRRAARNGVAVTSFSILPEQAAFRRDLQKQIRRAGKIHVIESRGPCDPKSKWGGLFFYAFHQVDTILKAFGPGIEQARVIPAGRGNGSAIAVLTYGDGGPIATLSLVAQGYPPFAVRALGEKGVVEYVNRFDENPYLAGTRKFLAMFRTGKRPHTVAEILEPIAVLEAMRESYMAGGKAVRVRRVPG